MSHGEYYRGSLDKVGLFARDLEWKSGLAYFQGIPRYYIVALIEVVLMKMVLMEVVMMV